LDPDNHEFDISNHNKELNFLLYQGGITWTFNLEDFQFSL